MVPLDHRFRLPKGSPPRCDEKCSEFALNRRKIELLNAPFIFRNLRDPTGVIQMEQVVDCMCFIVSRVRNDAVARVLTPRVGLSLEFWRGNRDYYSCFLVYVISQTTYFVVS